MSLTRILTICTEQVVKLILITALLTIILPYATMDLFCRECRARSNGTNMQSDLALHSLLLSQ